VLAFQFTLFVLAFQFTLFVLAFQFTLFVLAFQFTLFVLAFQFTLFVLAFQFTLFVLAFQFTEAGVVSVLPSSANTGVTSSIGSTNAKIMSTTNTDLRLTIVVSLLLWVLRWWIREVTCDSSTLRGTARTGYLRVQNTNLCC
jgi:hypothetical protein